jgi:preprotein translocase subunit SecF
LSASLLKRRFAAPIVILALSVVAISFYFGRGPQCTTDANRGARFQLQATEPIDVPELQGFLKTKGIDGVSISQTDDPAAVVLTSAGKTWGREAIQSLQAALKNFGDVQIAHAELVGPAAGCP